MKRKIMGIALLGVLLLAGCGAKDSNNDSDKKDIKIGGTSISQTYYEAAKKDYEAKGYKTEFIPFDSNPVVLEACNSGDVDIAIGQHLKFVESFNKTKGGDLAMTKPYAFYTGIGLYSEKHKSIDEIPENGSIAIMNDPMNMDIALRILQDCGLIKLKDGVESYTIADISENPKHLKIVDVDQAQTVTALNDMDAACIFFTHMANAGKDPKSYLARDKQMINYPMGVIVRKENVDAKWSKDFAECFRQKDVQEKIEKEYPGVFEFYKSDDEVKE